MKISVCLSPSSGSKSKLGKQKDAVHSSASTGLRDLPAHRREKFKFHILILPHYLYEKANWNNIDNAQTIRFRTVELCSV
jgi:hypothetical protein